MMTYKVTYIEDGTHEGYAIVESPSRLEAGLVVTDSAKMEGVKRLLTSITRVEATA